MGGTRPGHNLIPAIVGPTASGKGAFALFLAQKYPVRLVSVDSRKIYIGMDIGTGKPSPEIRKSLYLLMDILTPDQVYSAQDFARDAETAITSVLENREIPVLVGGAILYFKALFEGLFPAPPVDRTLRKKLMARITHEGAPALHAELASVDPVSAARIHPNDGVRIERALEIYYLTRKPMSELWAERRQPRFRPLFITLPVDRETLYARINQRVGRMMNEGLLDEVRALVMAYGASAPGLRAIGYQELSRHILGEISLDDAVALIKRNTRTFARRQTYFMRGLGKMHTPEEGERFIGEWAGGLS
ncbi:MAG: tRNA (adenosine(37)-N6)-dimethylallyltransferase MiaA [candidate division WOR-3 bacterium]